MIPKNLFVYWGGGSLSFIRYLTIVTFKIQNPDWKVYVAVPAVNQEFVLWETGENKKPYVGKDWLPEAKQLANGVLTISMPELGFSDDMPEVWKSDIVRNYLLASIGGYWTDFDTVFFKPIPDTLRERDFVCYNGLYYTIGFLGAHEASPFYRDLFERQKRQLVTPDNFQYQVFGASMLTTPYEELIKTYELDNMPMHLMYFFNADIAEALYLPNYIMDFPPDAFAVHWWGGYKTAKRWENMINPNNFDQYKHVLGLKLKTLAPEIRKLIC